MLWAILYLYDVALWITLFFWSTILCLQTRFGVTLRHCVCVLTVTQSDAVTRLLQIRERAKQWTRKTKYMLCCACENLLCSMEGNIYVMHYDFCTDLMKSELSFWNKQYLCFEFYTIVEPEHMTKTDLFTHMQIGITFVFYPFLQYRDPKFRSLKTKHTHTHRQTYIYTYIHTNIHTYIHARAHTHSHTSTRTLTYKHMRTNIFFLSL
jgi:hypothetical protein